MVIRTRNKWIGLVSALLAMLIVYGIYVIQLKQVEMQRTVSVPVPASFIPAGTMLTKELLEWKSIVKGALHEDMATDMGELLEMENLIPLGEGEPVLLWKVDKFRLLPSADQATFRIPKDYLLAVSSGVRAGDEVDLYVTGEQSRKLFPHTVKVASVQSSSGVEVDDKARSNLYSSASGDKFRMYASRREAGGVIDHVDLNLSEEEWLVIDQLCKDGKSKLLVAFTPLSIRGDSL